MRLSVIIPCLDEAVALARLLPRLARDCAPGDEVIVADGGSADGSRAVARRLGATVVRSRRGRAAQLNAGAARAYGDLLLFWHADTLPGPGWRAPLVAAFADPRVVAGYCRQALRPRLRGTDFVATAVRLRSWLGLPYGDQGLAVRGAAFRAAGGYPELPLMEDLALARRLRRRGRVVELDATAVTSSRRFAANGVARTVLLNYLLVLGYLGGVPVARLAAWRSRLRSR